MATRSSGKSALGSSKIIAFVGTGNPDRAKAFYRDTLGLRFVSEDQFAIVFDAHGIMLRVAIVPVLTPAKYTVLGWEVSDIAATVKELQKSGVKFERYGFMDQDDLGVWTSPSGAKIAWFKDPDENILSVTQL